MSWDELPLLKRVGIPNGLPILPSSLALPEIAFVPTLTDKFVRSCPGGEHTDEVQRGLILLVRPSTSKSRPDDLRRSWVMRVVQAGKRRRIGLADTPQSDLPGRARRPPRCSNSQKGQDPTRKGRARRRPRLKPRPIRSSERSTNTSPRLPLRSSIIRAKRAASRLTADLRASNDRLVEEIGTREIVTILKSLAPGTADRTRSALNGRFAFAAVAMERRGVLIRNPVSSDLLKAAGYVKNVSHGRQPALSYPDLPAFLSEVEKIERRLRAALNSSSRRLAAQVPRVSPNTATSTSRRGYGASLGRL